MGEAEELADDSAPIIFLRALYALSAGSRHQPNVVSIGAEAGLDLVSAYEARDTLALAGLVVSNDREQVELTERGRARAAAAESR